MKLLVCIAAIFLGTTSAISLDDLLSLDADGLDDLLKSESQGGSSKEEFGFGFPEEFGEFPEEFGGFSEEEFSPPAFCSIASDVLFIIDSSANVQAWDFATIKAFVHEIAAGLDITDDLSRVSLVRYADSADSRFFFNTFNNKLDVLQAINDVPYSGGVYSDPGILRWSVLHHLQSHNGWRENMQAPSAVVIITGSSLQSDSTDVEYIHSKATRVITIGVGFAVDASKLSILATSEDDELLIDNAMSLMGEVQGVLEKICDMDGDVNECSSDALNNCEQVCSNKMTRFSCACEPGYMLVDGTNCNALVKLPLEPFLLSTTKMSFNKAQQFCKDQGRELVEMATEGDYLIVAEWVFTNFNKPSNSHAEIWTGMTAVHTDGGIVAQLSDGQAGFTKWTKRHHPVSSYPSRKYIVLVTSKWRPDCAGCGLRNRGRFSQRMALCGNV